MIKRVCSYCEVELGILDDPTYQEDRISHGVCNTCLAKKLEGSGESLNDFIDSLRVPIFVVDDNVRCLTANPPGCEMVGKNLSQIKGRLGGEIFGCPHSSEPGGCGETLHCQSCTIRRTTTATFESGKPNTRVPACMDLETFEGPRKIHFLISTEKKGNAVLLRIDEM